MHNYLRRIGVFSAVLAAVGLTGSAALALVSSDTTRGSQVSGPGSPEISFENRAGDAVDVRTDTGLYVAGRYAAALKAAGDRALGLGGTNPGPLPGPTPGLHPEDYANAAIQAVASGLGDVALGLGGVRVGPIPAPTPGFKPVTSRVEQAGNAAIVTAAAAVGDAALGLGGVRVGPIPAPTPGFIPAPQT